MRHMPNIRKQDQRGITGLETAIVLIAFVVVSSVFAFAALSTGLFSADKSKETIRAGLSEARGTLELRGAVIAKAQAFTAETAVSGAGATTGALNNLPVVIYSETVTHSVSGDLSRVTGNPTGTQYTINYVTGVITLGSALAGAAIVTADYSAQIIDELTYQVANAAGGEAVDLTPGMTLITYLDANQSVNLGSADFTVTALGSSDTDKLVEPGEMYEITMAGLAALLGTDLQTGDLFTVQVKPPQGAVLQIERTTPVELDKINDLG